MRYMVGYYLFGLTIGLWAGCLMGTSSTASTCNVRVVSAADPSAGDCGADAAAAVQ